MPLNAALVLLLLGMEPSATATTDSASYAFARTDTFKLQADILSADVGVADGADGMGSWTRVELVNAAFTSQRALIRFDQFTGRAGASSVERWVTVAPRGSAAFIVWIPSGVRGGRVSLHAPSGDVDSHGFYSSVGGAQVVAVGTEASFTEVAGRAPVDSNAAPAFRVATLPAELLPEELMSYSGMPVVYLGESRLERLTRGQQSALEAYAAVGGRLVLGKCSPLTLTHLPLLKALPAGEAVPYGFGQVAGCSGRSAAPLMYFAAAAIAATPEDGLPYSGSFLGGRPLGWSGSVVQTLLPEANPPVGIYYGLVAAFALLVGPGSLWVVRRRGPLWLLATLPGATLLTSLLMIGSALAGNGLKTLASLRAITLLDNAHGRAVSVGMGAFFSGRTPPEVVVPNTAAWYPREGALTVEAAYTLRSGFIPARVYTELSMAQVSATRARVILRRGGSELTLQNALGGDIVRIRFREGGKDYVVGSIRDGGEGSASRAGGPLVWEPWPLPQLLFDRALGQLADGEFVALVQGTGFLPLPIRGMSLSDRRTQQWVRGTLQP